MTDIEAHAELTKSIDSVGRHLKENVTVSIDASPKETTIDVAILGVSIQVTDTVHANAVKRTSDFLNWFAKNLDRPRHLTPYLEQE